MNDIKQAGRIAVLMGGVSSEREISLKSGKAVFTALSEAGCDAVAVELKTTKADSIIAQLKDNKADVVFIVLHGKFGEDGAIQTILQSEGFPYTGCGPEASRLAMDKGKTQTLLKSKGIPVPEFWLISKEDVPSVSEIVKKIGLPAVVKPTGEGSSIGITIVREEKDLGAALELAFSFGTQVLVEQFIVGKEITSGILDQQALALVEIRPKAQFFDFTAKYQKGQSEYIVPAQLDKGITRHIQALSLQIFELLGCRDMARSDFMVDQAGHPYFLELNTIPGFTATSLLPMAAQEAGINFSQLCQRIAGFAFARRVTAKTR